MKGLGLSWFKAIFRYSCLLMLMANSLSTTASAIFIDGKGHYSLRGETRTHPGFAADSGLYQATQHNLRLNTEVRASDRASMVFELRMFDNPRAAYLGDKAQPAECSPIITQNDGSGNDIPVATNTGNAEDCEGRHQNSSEPAYKPYYPRIQEAYALYATDYCLIKAGRRGRQWGMGIFLDTDYDPFETSSSVFDGITCDINIQKSQTLAMSFGYDKLAETGSAVDEAFGSEETFGATNPSDDLEQYFFTIQYDDRKANAGSPVTQQVGIYFANVVGGKNAKTDIKFADLYVSFFLQDWILKQEVLFRLGKSADPSYSRLGGALYDSVQDTATNKVDSIAAAGSLEYIVSHSGSVIGPAEYKQGTAKSHSLFLEYAYAPGDKDGYQPQLDVDGTVERTDTSAKAVAFHRNFKPALILFNAPPQVDDLRVDGVFDPGRIMNATVFGLGYRFKSLESGNFELKLLTAQLNEGMPGSIKEQYAISEVRPVGYEGRSLGHELDLKYDIFLSNDLNFGVNGAIALPGDAWKIRKDEKPKLNSMIQSFVNFYF